jgi:hypothetical protein
MVRRVTMQQPPTLNALKFQYRKENIFTMEDLLSILNVSPSVTVHEASADDFFDYDKLFSLYYADFQSKIKQNHIFACANEMSGNQLLVRLRESNLEEHPVTTHKVIKKGFYGCKNYATLTEAVNNRPKDMKASTKDLLEKIVSKGLNAYKQVKMHKNYRPIVPPKYQDNILYKEPPKLIFDVVKTEKHDRKKNQR